MSYRQHVDILKDKFEKDKNDIKITFDRSKSHIENLIASIYPEFGGGHTPNRKLKIEEYQQQIRDLRWNRDIEIDKLRTDFESDLKEIRNRYYV